jgi:hypothetical protein
MMRRRRSSGSSRCSLFSIFSFVQDMRIQKKLHSSPKSLLRFGPARISSGKQAQSPLTRLLRHFYQDHSGFCLATHFS